jgi:hypothetical protein
MLTALTGDSLLFPGWAPFPAICHSSRFHIYAWKVVLGSYIYSRRLGLNLKVLEDIKIYSPIAHHLPAEAHYHEPTPVSSGRGKICRRNPCSQRALGTKDDPGVPPILP